MYFLTMQLQTAKKKGSIIVEFLLSNLRLVHQNLIPRDYSNPILHLAKLSFDEVQ